MPNTFEISDTNLGSTITDPLRRLLWAEFVCGIHGIFYNEKSFFFKAKPDGEVC
jgi:hypothetical protein